jgi:hypothetical protein
MIEIFSVKKEFENEINNIWNNPLFSKIEVIKRGYGIHDEIIKNSILFIGINPSYSEKKSQTGNYFINLNQKGKNNKDILYPYFKKFVDISEKLNTEWSHMDLLFFRETKQCFISELLKEDAGVEFISNQLSIAKKIILRSKPKVIIVSNTKARDFMKSKNKKFSMNLEFEFNEDLGTEIIINNSHLNNVPVFFTSMLSGQRALDNGSYKRLIWHIKLVLKIINKSK